MRMRRRPPMEPAMRYELMLPYQIRQAIAENWPVVLPLGVNKCAVIFDYYFGDVSAEAEAHNQASIRVSEKVQDEDMAICDSVQRGLSSRAYLAGRLSVRREAGEHLFHRLLHADMTKSLGLPIAAD